MEIVFEYLVGVLCYWLGFGFLKIVTLGRYQGKSRDRYGFVEGLGLLILITPLATLITLKIIASAQ